MVPRRPGDGRTSGRWAEPATPTLTTATPPVYRGCGRDSPTTSAGSRATGGPADTVVTTGAAQALSLADRRRPAPAPGSTPDRDRGPGQPRQPGPTTRRRDCASPRSPSTRPGSMSTPSPVPGVRAVFVTPAHQFPTGVVLAPRRRAQLVDWARRTGGLIVEDDYDAEFRYDRDPVALRPGARARRGRARRIGQQGPRARAAARLARRTARLATRRRRGQRSRRPRRVGAGTVGLRRPARHRWLRPAPAPRATRPTGSGVTPSSTPSGEDTCRRAGSRASPPGCIWSLSCRPARMMSPSPTVPRRPGSAPCRCRAFACAAPGPPGLGLGYASPHARPDRYRPCHRLATLAIRIV